MSRRPSTPASILYVLSFYAILAWCYLAANALVHPRTLAMPLTHVATWPSEGLTAAVCFVLSAVLFFGARVLAGERS